MFYSDDYDDDDNNKNYISLMGIDLKPVATQVSVYNTKLWLHPSRRIQERNHCGEYKANFKVQYTTVALDVISIVLSIEHSLHFATQPQANEAYFALV